MKTREVFYLDMMKLRSFQETWYWHQYPFWFLLLASGISQLQNRKRDYLNFCLNFVKMKVRVSNISFILIVLPLFIQCMRVEDSKKNILELTLDIAINKKNIPDLNSLYRNKDIFGDTFIISSRNDTIYKLLKNLHGFKFKVMTLNDICNLALEMEKEDDWFVFPNIVLIDEIKVSNNHAISKIDIVCVITNPGVGFNHLTGEPGDSSRYGTCEFAQFLGGGGIVIEFKKSENEWKWEIIQRYIAQNDSISNQPSIFKPSNFQSKPSPKLANPLQQVHIGDFYQAVFVFDNFVVFEILNDFYHTHYTHTCQFC
jgi:hypothetical protein